MAKEDSKKVYIYAIYIYIYIPGLEERLNKIVWHHYFPR